MQTPAIAPNVLVAVDEPALRRVRTLLAAWRVTFVRNRRHLEEALSAERFHLVLVGSHFDQGRPLPAIDAAVRRASAVPVVCAITDCLDDWVGAWRYSAFRAACLELGACDTLDFTRWRDDSDGNSRLRLLIESRLRP